MCYHRLEGHRSHSGGERKERPDKWKRATTNGRTDTLGSGVVMGKEGLGGLELGCTKDELGCSHCGAMESVASWERWDTGSIPNPAQWALLQLKLRLQLLLRSDPWPGNAICHGGAKNEKKKQERRSLGWGWRWDRIRMELDLGLGALDGG